MIPTFKLYAANGSTLLYTFPVVQYTNIPVTEKKAIVVEGQRGIGSLVIDAGEDSPDIIIRGLLFVPGGQGYEELTALIDALESAIVFNTPYVLKLSKTSSTSYSYNVKRVEPIEYPENLRNNSQDYIVKLKANTW